MKRWRMFATLLLTMVSSVSHATISTFTSGSTGANGAFNPSVNTVVTLPASGVLNYTTINIPSGITVTFVPNALNTPVWLLATGDVTIAGTINVNGSNATTSSPGAGGPGGFSGGWSYTPYTVVGGAGLGPGGGIGGGLTTTPKSGAAGSYAGVGTGNAAGSSYGNANILPLIGGSGGGGGYYSTSIVTTNHGGGGGGSILIAASGTITFSGTINAKGGAGSNAGGNGSAGGIKLLANTITGTGAGASGALDASSSTGGYGRIRLEAYQLSYYGTSTPAYTYGIPSSVFGSASPSIAITSIGGINVPTAPTGSYVNPDITLSAGTTNPITVNISATNIPVGTVFSVKLIPQGWTTTTPGNDLPPVTTMLSGTTASSSGSASVTVPPTCTTVGVACTSVIMVQATFTVTAFNYQGEEIDRVQVATSSDGKTETIYITKSGKEIKVS
jgi:hypothetical protein